MLPLTDELNRGYALYEWMAAHPARAAYAAARTPGIDSAEMEHRQHPHPQPTVPQRHELDMTFYEWRTQLRIYHALVLLADGRETTQTAYACGWANPSSFIAAFTNILGTTPGRYRTKSPDHRPRVPTPDDGQVLG